MRTVCILFAILTVVIGAIAFVARPFCGGKGGAFVQATRQDFTTFISHLDQYRNIGRNGYPTNEQGLKALVERPTIEPLSEDWVQALPEIPLDPWKNPYRYQMPGSKKDNEPELISAGPDGIFDTEDDLSSQD